MTQSLILRGARQLLTLRGKPGVRRGPQSGNLEVIEDGSVFIQDGKVVSVGTTRRLENLKEIRGAIEIPVHKCIVLPGFIDSYLDLNLIAPASSHQAHLKRRRLSDFFSHSINLMRACLQHGTLNVGVRASSGVHSKGADLSMLRQLKRIGNNPIGVNRIWCPQAGELDHWETIERLGLADSVAFTQNDPRLSTAAASGMNVRLDWNSGSRQELQDLLQRSAAASVFCRHALSPGERSALANGATTSIFKAGSSLLDTLPGSDVRELVDEGGAIALGSGYDAHAEPNFSMQLVLALAVRRLNLTIEEAIVATTINAAYAMNCGDEVGSLEPGKRADLLVLNLNDYREIPRRLGVNHVAMAIRNGEIVINRTKWRVGAA